MASTLNRRSLLTGAAAGVAPAGIAAPYVRAQSAITLSFMTWGAPAEQEAFNALIAKYRTVKPNVTVRVRARARRRRALPAGRHAPRRPPGARRVSASSTSMSAANARDGGIVDLSQYVDDA
jgi:hypothetical protein